MQLPALRIERQLLRKAQAVEAMMRQRMLQQQGATETASAPGAVRQDSVFFRTLLCPKCASGAYYLAVCLALQTSR